MDAIDRYLIQSSLDDINRGTHKGGKEVSTGQIQPLPHHYDYLQRDPADIPKHGTKYKIRVKSDADLERTLVKTDTAYVYIPAAQIEQPPGTGRCTTVGGLLDDIMTSLEKSNSYVGGALDKCINSLYELKSGRTPFTIIIEDPLSGSEVEAWLSDATTGKLSVEKYVRSWEESEEYGLLPNTDDDVEKTDDEILQGIIDLIRKSNKIVALTGAGISTESGIPAYRNVEGSGIWNIYSLEDEEIGNFNTKEESRINYWKMKFNLHKAILNARPCGAHIFFDYLHKNNKLERIVTQNIDGLHEAAGVPIEKIIEIHGNTNTSHCMTCGYEIDSASIYKEMEEKGLQVPVCKCGGFMHPNTISYGVPLDNNKLNAAKECMKTCDLLVIVGSSLVVSPVNKLPGITLAKGTPVIMVNIGETMYDKYVSYLVQQKAGETFDKILEKLKADS